MIVKNGGENLRKLLTTAKPFVKEMIVVDTGSQDHTVAIAKECGAHMESYIWNDDFSAARNFSTKNAKGEYIIYLDADEYVDEQGWKDIAASLDQNAEGFTLLQRNYTNDTNTLGWQPNTGAQSTSLGYFDNPVVRVFTNDPRVRFSYRVHEIVDPSLKAINGKIKQTDIVIHHFGFLEQETEQKRNYYLSLGLIDVEQFPNDPRPNYEVGLIYFRTRRFSSALEHLSACYNSDPHYKRVGVVLAQTYAALDKPKEALSTISHYLTTHQKDGPAYITLGILCMAMGDHEMAKKAFKTTLSYSPKHPIALLNLGMAALKDNEKPLAQQCFEDVVTILPTHESARINLAILYVEQGKKKQAIAMLEPLAGKSTNPNLFSTLAKLYMQHGRKDHAIKMFEKSIELGSKFSKQFKQMIEQLKEDH